MKSIGRNDPCSCGSGKKYKRCCLDKDRESNRNKNPKIKTPEDLETGEYADSRNGFERFQNDNFSYDDFMFTEDRSLILDEDDDRSSDIPEEHQAVIDAWWDDIEPLIVDDESNLVLDMIYEFLKKYPDLFRYLHLEDDLLPELGTILYQNKEWARFTDLLKKLRHDQPVMYESDFPFLDYQIIFDLAATGKRDRIPEYLNLYQKEPGRQYYFLKQIIYLFAWLNLDREMKDLLESLDLSGDSRIYEVDKEFYMSWLVLFEYIKVYDIPESINKRIALLIEHLQKLNLGISMQELVTNLKPILESVESPPETFSPAGIKKNKLYKLNSRLS